jgi:hypothetical protein
MSSAEVIANPGTWRTSPRGEVHVRPAARARSASSGAFSSAAGELKRIVANTFCC